MGIAMSTTGVRVGKTPRDVSSPVTRLTRNRVRSPIMHLAGGQQSPAGRRRCRRGTSEGESALLTRHDPCLAGGSELAAAGRRLDRHLRSAVGMGRLCSNDPVCAQHSPDNKQEERFLSGAACHGCLLIAEPSCERRNEFLDRALVVGTVEALGTEFFANTE